MSKKLLIVILVLIVSTISFGRSFLGLLGVIPWHYGYSDVFNEDRINPELAKKIPYLDKPIEYPVLTGFFIYFMWYLGKNLLGYVIFTFIFLTASVIITALTLYKLCRLLEVDEKRIFWFFIFAPSLIFFGIYNWDIIAVMFMVLAMYSFYKNSYGWAALFLSFGFNAKLFPIIILPIILLKVNFKQCIKILTIFLLTSFILNIYFIINSFDVWKATYTFHTLREPNIDSIWALTHLDIKTINILSISLFLLSYLVLIFYHKKYEIITLSFLSMLVFLLFNKIFSPQYILWLTPFFVLSQNHENLTKKIFYSLETANLLVFFSTLHWIFAVKWQIFLIASNMSAIARSFIMAYLLVIILKITK